MGKQVLSRRIADFALSFDFVKKQSLVLADNTLKIVEADMRDVMDQYCNDSEVAFAHCISSDFENNKHMSQGVAVSFKEKFGKPSYSNYCDKHITYQKTEGGASVYSLVTKPNYFLNAKHFLNYKENYNMAFTQLKRDFNKRNLIMHICSPMGCIRDRLQPDHFIDNIIDFKKTTGAAILIVTSEDTLNSNLRCGLTHFSFVKYLHQITVNKLHQEMNTNTFKGNKTIGTDCSMTTLLAGSAGYPTTTTSDSPTLTGDSTTISAMSEVCTSSTSVCSSADMSPRLSTVVSDEGCDECCGCVGEVEVSCGMGLQPSDDYQINCMRPEIQLSPTATLPANCTIHSNISNNVNIMSPTSLHNVKDVQSPYSEVLSFSKHCKNDTHFLEKQTQ